MKAAGRTRRETAISTCIANQIKRIIFTSHITAKGCCMSSIGAIRVLLLCLAAAITAGCATPYGSYGLAGGYEETRLGEDIWRVNFTGNGYTSKQRAQDFTLLRCAELALDNGYPYFVIVDGQATNSAMFVPGAATSQTTFTGNRATTQTYGGGMVVAYPTTTNTIMGLKEKPASGTTVTYDAKYIIQSLRKKYEIAPDVK